MECYATMLPVRCERNAIPDEDVQRDGGAGYLGGGGDASHIVA